MVVTLNNRKGLMNKEGSEEIEPKFDEIYGPVVQEVQIVRQQGEKKDTLLENRTYRIVKLNGKMGLYSIIGESSVHEFFEAEYDTIYYSDEYKNWVGQQ